MTRRPPSSMRQDSARAGRSSSVSSKVVSVSKNWAITAALPASPVAAGSRLVGSPSPIRAVPSLAAAGGLGTRAGKQCAGEQGHEQGGPAQHRPEYTGDARRTRGSAT